MPTNAITFADDDIDMRWKEPYLTEGLNEKLMVMPRGIYRGFELIPSLTPLNIKVATFTVKSDHLALVETQNNYSLTVRRLGGGFDIDLTAYAGQTVILAIYVAYSVGTPTAGYIRVYTAAEYAALTTAAQLELTILGTVTVPGAGVIPSANISYALRTLPSMTASINTVPWVQLLRNGDFEQGAAALQETYAIPYWEAASSAAPSAYFTLTTPPDTGARALAWNHATTGTWQGSLLQYLDVPVRTGQRWRLTFRMQRLIPAASIVTGKVYVRYRDAAGAIVVPPWPELDLALTGGPDGGWVSYALEGAVPAGAVTLGDVLVFLDDIAYAGTGVLFKIDRMSLTLQPVEDLNPVDPEGGLRQYVNASGLVMAPVLGNGTYSTGMVALSNRSTFGPSEGTVHGRALNSAEETPQLRWDGRLRVGDGFLSSLAQRLQARVELPYDQLVLLFESADAGGGGGVSFRLYAGAGNTFYLSFNAVTDGTAWSKDASGTGAWVIEWGSTRLQVYRKDAADNTAAPLASWPRVLASAEGASLQLDKPSGTGASSVRRVLRLVPDGALESEISAYVEGYILSAVNFLRRTESFNGSWNAGASRYDNQAAAVAPILQQIVDDTGWTFRVGSVSTLGVNEAIVFAGTDARRVRIRPASLQKQAVPPNLDPGNATITQLNVPKAVGFVGTGGVIASNYLFGATVAYSGLNVRVTYASALLPASETRSVVVGQLIGNVGPTVRGSSLVVATQTNTYFEFAVYDSTGTQEDLTTAAYGIAFAVYGYQS